MLSRYLTVSSAFGQAPRRLATPPGAFPVAPGSNSRRHADLPSEFPLFWPKIDLVIPYLDQGVVGPSLGLLEVRAYLSADALHLPEGTVVAVTWVVLRS